MSFRPADFPGAGVAQAPSRATKAFDPGAGRSGCRSSGLTLEEVRSTLITSTMIAAGYRQYIANQLHDCANDQIGEAEPFNDVSRYRNGRSDPVRDVGQAITAASGRTVAATRTASAAFS
jgi:hypothetical protein